MVAHPQSQPAADPPLVLASGSPRRRELLSALGASFTLVVTDAEESEEPPPPEVAGALPAAPVPLLDNPALRAWRKATAAAEQAPEAVVLGADTIVVLDGAVLNKPADAAEARAMLRRLAGRAHTVYTGLCVIVPNGAAPRPRLELVAAEVAFRPLAEGEIAAYVATGEPLDKAGAYGLQGLGGSFVREVRGSYTAVVGFPLPAAHGLLTAAGVVGLADPTTTYRRWLASQGKEPLPWPPTLP
ncbi:MAG TPA: Maf family protein [Chloroflexaceae bacterium]|nr:Maf family protein [Chloroflexaceae bacterium]